MIDFEHLKHQYKQLNAKNKKTKNIGMTHQSGQRLSNYSKSF
jgi:hypothetical protein